MQEIPNIVDLKAQIANDFKTKLNLSTTDLKYVLDVFDGVLAAQFYIAYQYLRDIQNNAFPDGATSELNGGTLERFGRIRLGRNPRPQTAGVFKIKVTGSIGTVLRTSLTFKSNEDALNTGKLYILDNQTTLTSTNQLIDVRSIGGGTEFNLKVGDKLTVTEPVLGLDNISEVTAIVQQPLSSEDLEDYRNEILNSFQIEPQGGSRGDYRLWANDAQGVRLVFPYVKDTDSGQVDVYVEATKIDSSDNLGTPTGAILTDVTNVINLDPDITKPIYERSRLPIQVILNVLPISLTPVDVQVTGLNNNSAAVQATLRTNIEEFLFNVRPYIAGADLPSQKNNKLFQSKIQSIVNDSLDTDNFFNSVTMFVNGVSKLDYEFGLGFIPYLRNLIV